MAFSGALPLRRAAVVAGAAGALAAGMLAAAGPASAQPLACGTTLVASVTLTANLDCTGDTTTSALTVGTAGITVDLDGHKILGPGDPAGTSGIADNGQSDVTVKDGTISDFHVDVSLLGASGADLTGILVQNLTTTDKSPQQSTAVSGEYLDGASIENLSARDAGTGVYLEHSQDSTVSGSHMLAPGTGIAEYSGSANTFSGNTISGVAGTQGSAGTGILVWDSTGDLVQSNAITGQAADGVEFEATDVTVTQNVLNDLDTAVQDAGSESEPDNTVSDNTGSHDAWGIFGDFPVHETYTGNTFSHCEYGIEAFLPVGTTLTGNTTDHNTEAGIYVYQGGDTLVYATLSDNAANDNRFGLYSQIPTSGSGNQASGNKVVNCYNVSCTG